MLNSKIVFGIFFLPKKCLKQFYILPKFGVYCVLYACVACAWYLKIYMQNIKLINYNCQLKIVPTIFAKDLLSEPDFRYHIQMLKAQIEKNE